MIKSQAELDKFLEQIDICSEGTRLVRFDPKQDKGVERLSHASFIASIPINIEYGAGEWREYGRHMFVFTNVRGWEQFGSSRKDYFDVSHVLSEGESEMLSIGFGTDEDNCLRLEFEEVTVATLDPLRFQNVPFLKSDVYFSLPNAPLPSAQEVLSWFSAAGHDVVWRIGNGAERSADQIENFDGFYLQYRELVDKTSFGIKAEFEVDENELFITMDGYSRDATEEKLWMKAIADVAKFLKRNRVSCGNCTLTPVQLREAYEHESLRNYLNTLYDVWHEHRD